jgi:predicted ATPase
VQPTPFVGREAELRELDQLLTDPDVRLVTVLGAGGMGKTRLAQEAAARQLERYSHGVYLVSLAPLRSAEAIVPTVADAIGFTFRAARGQAAVAPRQQLLDYLRQKNTLLLFDNYEHLLEGVDLVSDVLREAPEVRVLATSRASLNVQEEHLFHIAGMAFPDWETPEDALEYSAVKLFMQSARRVRPGFALQADDLRYISRICRLVQGMPLGILLAAAWVEMLTPGEIAAEVNQGLDFLATDLRNVPERQRSMRAVFDYSWSLLPEREQAVMEALSVFRGGFTRGAAQEVTGASLRALMALVNRSLLHRAPTGRYEVHELLRQYAAEKLDRSPAGGGATRDRHAAHYAMALGRWAADLKGPRQLAALREIEADVDNARAAWDWAVEQGQVAWLDRALEGLCLFFEWGGHYAEGEAACRKAAGRLGESAHHLPTGPTSGNTLRVLAHALAWQGGFAHVFMRSEVADRCFERALAVLDSRGLSDQDARRERAFVLLRMAEKASSTDLEAARQLAECSLEIYRTLDDRWGMAKALTGRAVVAFWLGTFDEMKQWCEESLALSGALGDRRQVTISLLWLGLCADHLGQLEEAERVAEAAMAVAQQLGDGHLIRQATIVLYTVLHDSGRFAKARTLRKECLSSARDQGDRREEIDSAILLGGTVRHLGDYSEAQALAQTVLPQCRESDRGRRTARCYLLLGRLALAEGAVDAAQEWVQQSIAIYQEVGRRNWIIDEALATLAYVACRLGQPAQARGHLHAALRMAAETHRRNTALQSLPAMALLLVDDGQVERAVEMYALVSRYPYVAHSRWFEDVAGVHIAAAAATLPPDVVAAAQERGRTRDLWATVEELLAELAE